jgi:hypothetical protein
VHLIAIEVSSFAPVLHQAPGKATVFNVWQILDRSRKIQHLRVNLEALTVVTYQIQPLPQSSDSWQKFQRRCLSILKLQAVHVLPLSVLFESNTIHSDFLFVDLPTMIPPKQEDEKNVLSGQEDPTENENEAPASDVFATTSPTDGAEVTDTGSEADAPKTRTDGDVKIPKPRLTCKEIKDEDEYFKCPKCDYVNKHPNDIGGRHFKSVHSDTPWDISQVHMFQRPEGGGGRTLNTEHIEPY